MEVIATRGHTGGQPVRGRGGDGAYGLLICDAAYTPRHYAEPGSDKAPSGQASDVLAWHDAVRPIHSLRLDRVHSCHHSEIVHS